MTSYLRSGAILIAVGVLVGCGGGPSGGAGSVEPGGTGSIQLVVTARGTEARVADSTYVVTVAVTGPASQSVTLNQGLGLTDPWTGRLDNLPVGSYAAVADATESPSGKVFHASGICPVTTGVMSLCSLDLQQVGGIVTFNDVAPLISSFSSSNAAPKVGEKVTFSMIGSTLGLPGPSGISFACGGVADSGATIVPSSAKITTLPGWDNTFTYSADLTTTCNTTETVTFTVSDLKGLSSTVTMTFTWGALPAQGLNFSVTINHWPDISSVWTPDGQVPAGAPVSLTVKASDADGDLLAYQWSSGCGGAFSSGSQGLATFTAPAPFSGPCTLSVLVTDGKGGSNTGSLTIQIGEPGALVHSTTVQHASGVEVLGVPNSSPAGTGGSIEKVPVPCSGMSCLKAEYYFVPFNLFGHGVTVGEVKSISYWTLKAADHVVAPADWYFQIYTMPYPAGTVGTQGSWYGARINTEPYFAEALTETPNTWTQWSSDPGNNQLRFYESTANYFGASTDLHLAPFVSGTSLAGLPYATQQVKYFSIQTSTSMESTFTGQVDTLLITLNDGSTALVDFEP